MNGKANFNMTTRESEPSARAAIPTTPVVMQVLPSLVTGGVERGTLDIAAALVKAGWKSIVVSSGGPLVRELERHGSRHIQLPVDSKSLWTVHRNIGRLAQVINQHHVDIVHARSRAPAWSAFYAAQRTGAAFLTTFHGTYNAGTRLKRWYNSIMTRGARVIAISEFIAWHIVAEYGVDPRLVRVIPRGVDFMNFDPSHVGAGRLVSQAREWRLPDGVPVIMLPGRLSRWKGQTVLIEALAKLGRRDVCCLLVGSDQGRKHYRSELEHLVKQFGLEGVVRTVDHCRDMPAAFMLADVVVSASLDPEAFGRVVAEAQAMGRPVVAPDHGGAQEIVIHGETGWLVPPGDASALARAIDEALSLDPLQRSILAERAITHVRAKFTRERMCAETLAVYNEVLQERAMTARGR